MTLVDFYLYMVPSDRNPGGVAGVFTLWPIPAINGSIKLQVDEKPAAPAPVLNISDLSVKTFISKWSQVWKESASWVVTEVMIGGGPVLNSVNSKPFDYFIPLICVCLVIVREIKRFSQWYFVLESCSFSLIISYIHRHCVGLQLSLYICICNPLTACIL